MAAVAIAYNTGRFNPAKGLKQGYFDGTKFYGENFFGFLQLAHSVQVPASVPAVATTRRQPQWGVATRAGVRETAAARERPRRRRKAKPRSEGRVSGREGGTPAKTAAKKMAAKRAAAKKASAKKAPAKKAAARKPIARKAAAKKPAARTRALFRPEQLRAPRVADAARIVEQDR